MKTILSILLLLISSSSIAQADSSNWKARISPCYAELGYIYQKEHMFEFGLKFEYLRLKASGRRWEKKFKDQMRHQAWMPGEGVSLIMGGQLTKNNSSTYLNPFVTIRYLAFSFESVRPVISISYSYRNQRGISVNIITPEVGINVNSVMNIKYGYNLFLDNQYDWVSNHRIAVRLMLF